MHGQEKKFGKNSFLENFFYLPGTSPIENERHKLLTLCTIWTIITITKQTESTMKKYTVARQDVRTGNIYICEVEAYTKSDASLALQYILSDMGITFTSLVGVS